NSGVRQQLTRIAEKHGFSEESLEEASSLVWHTLTRSIRVGESSSLKLAECEKRIHEMKFYFPLPDSRMPFTLLGTEDSQSLWDGEGWRVKSGFLNGSIDLVFEWEGRVYLLDWKSNLLENYSKQRLAEAVYEHYLMQLQIYALATVRWLKLHDEEAYKKRFGGILYVFLRGMKDVDAFHFERPSWAKLKAYESELERPRKSHPAAISA
ncbi:MAG: PD-(D/E)XK nuclease family protein, partial [SAR324 cluster bacterium]|nr:PD-(D/E)XK nuclease family protein [SAR324 cluster bacterium]